MTATRSAGRNPLHRCPARKPARDPPGSSSVTTPPCDPAVGRRADRAWTAAPDPRVADVRRRRGTARGRVARRGVGRSDATHRACRGPRLRPADSRAVDAVAVADATPRSWAEHGGSSAPRSPPNCAAPSGWSPVARNASPTRTPCRRIRAACGDSAVPPRWSFRSVWGGLADLADGTADEWSRLRQPRSRRRPTRPQGRPDRAA